MQGLMKPAALLQAAAPSLGSLQPFSPLRLARGGGRCAFAGLPVEQSPSFCAEQTSTLCTVSLFLSLQLSSEHAAEPFLLFYCFLRSS